jgi:molybdenum cofactor guanylyltransferase
MLEPDSRRDTVTGLILAGGQAQRMGGQDKGLLPLGGRPLISYTLERLAPQVTSLLINANRRQADYASLHYPVIGDDPPGYLGPLAGMAAGLRAARTPYLVTVPCDSPWLPRNYVARLLEAASVESPEIVVAYGEGRLQPVFALLQCALLPALQAYLAAGDRKIERWFRSRSFVTADFSDCPNMFVNINTPEDLRAIERELQNDHRTTTEL